MKHLIKKEKKHLARHYWKADCVIYVPAASVDAYKAAQYWSARASYIQAIQ